MQHCVAKDHITHWITALEGFKIKTNQSNSFEQTDRQETLIAILHACSRGKVNTAYISSHSAVPTPRQ